MASKLRADLIEEKIIEAKGNLSSVARAIGVDRTTIYKFIAAHPTLKTAVEEARETMLDNAESVLYQKVLAGESWAVCFFLKTQGHKRGYTEKHEVTGANGGDIVLRVVYGDDDGTEDQTPETT